VHRWTNAGFRLLSVGSHGYVHHTETVSGLVRQNYLYRLSTSAEFAIDTCADVGHSAADYCFIKRVYDTEYLNTTNHKTSSFVPGFSLTFSASY
jgi:hypothetical protein